MHSHSTPSRLVARRLPRLTLLERYLLRQFFGVFFICLFAAVSLFLVFETFERMRVFVKEGSTVLHAVQYLLYKVPLILHLMTPVAVLVATLLSVGRLSQLSEITAMRACGASILSLAKPLIAAGALISVLMFLAGETVVPWATQRVEDIYNLDIRKRDEKGKFSRANFWYRDRSTFYRIGFYDSTSSMLQGISILEIDPNFKLQRRIDAEQATWDKNPQIGWTMSDVTETRVREDGTFAVERYAKLPLIIKERPSDFYDMRREAETLSFAELGRYIEKLRNEGVPVTRYLVDQASKLSFPAVNLIVVLVAFPFALIPARSGSLSMSFMAGITIGFGYHVVHAISTSLGAAELIPVLASAWSANIILGSIGGYLVAGAEYN
ncbi:MAG: LPS export ABC transporter permease LptG [Bdellovibrionales bacterium]|nr:LPS export ABC transporter permease LptG [Bdellovibrionales bacterium]